MKKIIFASVFAFCAKILIILADDAVSYHLPNGKINIESYTVKLIPNLKDDFSFSGEVSVIVKVLEEMKCITMNSKDLLIKKMEFELYYDATPLHGTHKLLEDREMLELCFSRVLKRLSKLKITISFVGKMRDDFKGLYKVQYDENGSKKWMAATLLEPTYARTVFPCFDEPQYNAKFYVSIARYHDEKSSSITRLISTSGKDPQIDNRVWDTFKDTVPCAPYVMAFTVHSLVSHTERNRELSVYSKNHADKDAEFLTSNYLKWYSVFCEYLYSNSYFESYRDLVAVPDGDKFSQTGTITIYKEKDVFQIEGVDVEKHKEEIMKTSIHKIYHLWMGAFVRPHCWDDTWLSESFGIFFQYVMANEIYPLWETEPRFITEVLQEALFEEEMYPNSIITSPTKSPSEIQDQKFNSFINKKGASIINMLQDIIGTNLQRCFKNTIRKAHNDESDIKPNDLWDEIDREIKKTNLMPQGTLVKTFMQTWLQSSEYPLVTVLTNQYGEIIIKQDAYHSPITTNKNPDYNWIVPITCVKELTTEKKHKTWLHDSKPVIVDYHLKKDEWLLCNINRGYYRVSYNNENWNKLIEQLKSQPDQINRVARAQLLDDSFHLAIYNKQSFSIAFKLGTYLEEESDMLPWFSVIKYIRHLLRFYEDTDVIDYLKKYFLDLIKHQFNRMGFKVRKNDSYMTKIGRSDILLIACKLGLADCLTNSARVYNTYFFDLTKVPVESKSLVYCNSFEISKDKQEAWNKLWTVYKNSQSMSEKELVLSSLACVNDEIFYKKYLGKTIDPEEPPLFQYEKECIIKSCAKFYKGVTAILEVINEMIPKLGSSSEKIKQTLLLMAKEIHFHIDSSFHVEKAKQIVQQLENYKDKNVDLLESLKKSIELGTRKIDYKIKNGPEIKQAIHDITGYDPPTTTTKFSTTSITAHTTPVSTADSSKGTTHSPKVTTDSPEVPSSDCRVTSSSIKYLIICIGIISIVV